ncbi:MAG: lipoprotein-releasing protein [Bdellovibrionales bacterium RIFCSPHIGHO2_01_FULL_40_29]|nr:MAG: lipoprotein-releasing protein [Bdellovibrionales bacterium RIFCSPHIGHO2_01_FULL_40_29]OFZ32744.1 MAG: lipoprotein-releasing protein [Bdellovibrionales bacterium RIFCSPHIGHO2_02_FULL_40_15]
MRTRSEDFKFKIWIAYRLLFSKSFMQRGSAPLAFLGLILGVAALVAAMAVMSGFEETFKNALTDVTGHVQVVRRGKLVDDWGDFSKKLKSIEPRIESMMRFAYAEAVLAHKGQVSGILFQGVEQADLKSVLQLENRIKFGALKMDAENVVIGMGLAKRFQLKINDSMYIVVPLATPFDKSGFRRQAKPFKVSGILDFGKNDWNERLVIGDLAALQDLTQIGNRYTGAFIKMEHRDQSQEASARLLQRLGPSFAVMDWYDVNRNLFEAVRIERVIIFFVVFIIVVVAAFNISSTLYVFIRQRYSDIAILKTLGLSAKDIRKIFVGQGILVGVIGTIAGYFLGFLLCFGFMVLQNHFSLISGAVYKIDEIDVHLRAIDLLTIGISTIALCFVATLSPAIKGSRLEVVEGLKNG